MPNDTKGASTTEDRSAGATADLTRAANAYVREIVENSGSSFRLGMRFLTAPRRAAMYAIYAFCREVDDIADEDGSVPEKLAQLEAWRQEIDNLYSGHPTYPTARALLVPVRDFDLPKEEFLTVIDGMEMDARAPIWGPSLEELLVYCRRVAGAVGLLSIHAFGATRPPATEFALSLGNALQLTNILRDVHEDAQRDRLYLPREFLDKHGVTATTPEALLADPAVSKVCRDLAETAQDAFDASESLLRQLDRRRMRPAILMMAVYRRILERLWQRGWESLAQPVRISPLEKLAIVIRHGFF